jgi:hypothetical protein
MSHGASTFSQWWSVGFLRAFMQAAATILALTMFMAMLWARST